MLGRCSPRRNLRLVWLVVIDALALEGGSVHRAARRLGVTDATVYRLVDGLGLAGELDRIRSETPGAVRGRPPESRVGR